MVALVFWAAFTLWLIGVVAMLHTGLHHRMPWCIKWFCKDSWMSRADDKELRCPGYVPEEWISK